MRSAAQIRLSFVCAILVALEEDQMGKGQEKPKKNNAPKVTTKEKQKKKKAKAAAK